MKNILIVIMVSIFCTSAGQKDKKRDTCSLPAKMKIELNKKKIQKSKRPLYEMIFVI